MCLDYSPMWCLDYPPMCPLPVTTWSLFSFWFELKCMIFPSRFREHVSLNMTDLFWHVFLSPIFLSPPNTYHHLALCVSRYLCGYGCHVWSAWYGHLHCVCKTVCSITAFFRIWHAFVCRRKKPGDRQEELNLVASQVFLLPSPPFFLHLIAESFWFSQERWVCLCSWPGRVANGWG